MKKYLIVALAVLVGVIYVQQNALSKRKRELKRVAENQVSLLTELKTYRNDLNQSVAEVNRLKLNRREFRRHFADMEETIKSLGIKLKRAESAAATGTKTEIVIETEVRDSIVYRERVDTLRCLDIREPYFSLSGCIESDVFKGNIQIRDTLSQVVHRVPRKFLFFRWGTKAIRQTVLSSNPYTEINYSEYVELK